MNWEKNTGSDGNGWLSAIRNMGKQQWIVLLLVGVLLAVIAMPTAESSSSPDLSAESWMQSPKTEGSGEKQQLERELEELLRQVEGIGEIRVMLTLEEENNSIYASESGGTKVAGVLIAAQGADDLTVVQNIQEAVQALFQVEAHKIKVMKMK